MSATGGTPHLFAQSRASENYMLTWAPGPRILYQRSDIPNYHFLDPVTEEETSWLDPGNEKRGWVFDPRYSPDGKSVAVAWNRGEGRISLWKISPEDTSQVIKPKEDAASARRFPIAWSTDGDWIYAVNTAEATATATRIIKIHTTSGEVRTAALLPGLGSGLQVIGSGVISMTPDGKRFVVAVWEESPSDVWLVENFDPDAQ